MPRYLNGPPRRGWFTDDLGIRVWVIAAVVAAMVIALLASLAVAG
jgi:hypothetical protein